jgi:hypothetical protein
MFGPSIPAGPMPEPPNLSFTGRRSCDKKEVEHAYAVKAQTKLKREGKRMEAKNVKVGRVLERDESRCRCSDPKDCNRLDWLTGRLLRHKATNHRVLREAGLQRPEPSW